MDQSQQIFVDGIAQGFGFRIWRRYDAVIDEADDTVIRASQQAVDGFLGKTAGHDGVISRRSAAALDIAEDGQVRRKVGVFFDVVDDISPFGSTFGDDDDAAQFLHAVRFFQVTAKRSQIDGMFRDQDRFGTGSHAGIEGDETGFAAHDFDDGDAVMGERRVADLIDRFQDRIDSRIEPQGILRPHHIVVDGAGNGNRRDAPAAQSLGTAHGAVATDDNERIYFQFTQVGSCFLLRFFFLEFQAAGCPKHGAATMDDGTDVTAAQGARFMAKQAFITADDAFDSETLLDGIPRDAADSRIHTRSVAATGQYSDFVDHFTSFSFFSRAMNCTCLSLILWTMDSTICDAPPRVVSMTQSQYG